MAPERPEDAERGGSPVALLAEAVVVIAGRVEELEERPPARAGTMIAWGEMTDRVGEVAGLGRVRAITLDIGGEHRRVLVLED